MVLGIYGAGGLGRELLMLAQHVNRLEKHWSEIIFIDDTEGLTEKKGVQVLSLDKAVLLYGMDELEIVIAVGEPNVRKILKERVQESGYRLMSLIHPSANIGDGTKIGRGAVICYGSYISCDVVLGENVLIQPCASIGHDSQIGDDTVISSYVCIAGGCSIGKESYIGLSVPVKEKIIIGARTIIGMGSVVTRDIPDQVIAIGNPARVMKENTELRVFHSK